MSIKEFFDLRVFMGFSIVVQDKWVTKPVVSYFWKYYLLQKINIYLKIDMYFSAKFDNQISDFDEKQQPSSSSNYLLLLLFWWACHIKYGR
jgi:hypothetical protein